MVYFANRGKINSGGLLRYKMRKSLLAIIILFVLGAGGYVVFSGVLQKSQEVRVYKIGILVRGESYRPAVEGFLSKMKELGYEQKKNIEYDIRFVEKKEELPIVVKLFLEKGVDLIHTYSTPATVEASKQTQTVPIVFGSMGDPIASGVVRSLQRPGGNVTGIGSLSVDLTAKRLQFLKEIFPEIKKVAIPFTPTDIPGRRSFEVAEDTAGKLGILLVPYHITPEHTPLEVAQSIFRKDVDGMIVSADSLVWANLAAFIKQAAGEKIPFAVFDKDMVVKGGLVGYGPDYFTVGQQSAVITNKILHGAKPQELPIEVPEKFILAVNLRTARENGFNIPEKFLAKVDLLVK